MDTDSVRLKQSVDKRTESNKAHPWRWDNHIGPKNSKWLENNLGEMDRRIKRMLKLIEEDADSLTKKAEMYYRKRPELIRLVEEFYRMYRSLADRYDNIAGESRKSSLTDLQSQTSGVSDISSDLTSAWISEDHRISHRLHSRRAAGFEFFLASGGNNLDSYHKEGDDSASITDSEMESDDSSVNNYPGSLSSGCDFQALNRNVEVEAKEKLKVQNEGNTESLQPRMKKSEKKHDDLPAKLAAYEQELRDANEKIENSEKEISRLNKQLSLFIHGEMRNGTQDTDADEGQALAGEVRIERVMIQDLEKTNTDLREEIEKFKSVDKKLLESAQKEAAVWRNKSSADKREVVKLQERILMLKSSLAGRDQEIRDLKMAVSDAEENIFPEKAQIKAEISKLLEERDEHREQMKEMETRVRFLEDEVRRGSNEKKESEEKLMSEIEALNKEMKGKENWIERLGERVREIEREREEEREERSGLEREVIRREKRMEEMEKEVEKQRRKIEEGEEEKREVIRQLCFSLDHYREENIELLRKAFVTT